MENEKNYTWLIWTVVSVIILSIFFISLWAFPTYNVWRKELKGQASLAEAEWDKKIQIEEAKANLESEKLNAMSEVERARGVAEANTIIGEGLKDNEEYLRYLWIKGLQDEHAEVIYVPTEANLPILEATRSQNVAQEKIEQPIRP